MTRHREEPTFAPDAFLIGGAVALSILTCSAAFLYKVWNERQMTHQYERQATALERIADAVGGR